MQTADVARRVLERAGCRLHSWLTDAAEAPLVVLTHGEHDCTGNIRRIAPRWAAREPHCRYVVIPEAGHNANQDNPAFFNALLVDFLAEHVPVS